MRVRFFQLGAILMFLGVAFGAFGAHGLKALLTINGNMETYKTAVFYQVIHGLSIIFTTLSPFHIEKRIKLAATFFITGVLLFSGSLYFLSIFSWNWLGPITPVGGLSLLLGWVVLLVSAKQAPTD